MGLVISARAVAFRSRVIDRFCQDVERFHYIDRDTCIGVCPVCDGWLAIEFAGGAPRAWLRCERRCQSTDIWRAAFR